MDERPAAAPERWDVRHRPALIAGLATPVVMLALLLVSGWLYNRNLRPRTQQPVTAFPAPGLQTFIHDGVEDPYRLRPRTRPDAQVAAAKRAVVADGIAGWERQR